jgi:glycosyltransferase involved in cell wall biosynthesis
VEYGVHPSFYDLKWCPSPQQPYALFVGGADKRKGVDLLIDSLKLIPDRNWEVRFVGDPAIQLSCDAAQLKNVRCLGLLRWPDMQKQLQGAWCSILPTRGDTSPNSVKEARVIGVPVVTTKHGGQAGYIMDGINGRIVDPLNASNLAAALADVMSSHDRALRLGRGRHQEDRVYLHPRRTAEGFAEIYRELIHLKSIFQIS